MYKKSLFIKLLVWMLLAAVIPFIISNFISYRSTSHSIQKKVIEVNENLMDIGMSNIQNYMQELNLLSVSWYNDQRLMVYLRQKKSEFTWDRYIEDQISELYSRRPEIAKVSYLNMLTGKKYMKETHAFETGLKLPSFSQIPKDLDSLNGYEVYHGKGQTFLVIHKKFIDYPHNTLLGILTIYFKVTPLERFHTQLLHGEEEEVFLVFSHTEDILYGSNDLSLDSLIDKLQPAYSSQSRTGYFSTELLDKRGIFIFVNDYFKDVPLTLVKFISNDSINEVGTAALNKSIIIQAVTLALIILFALIISYTTIIPIKRLIRNMTQVEIGNFEVENFKKRQDELGLLESRFAVMVRRLKEMIIKEYQQQIEISTTRLKMLQAQINPHFLYNTLQSISTLALRYQVDEINERISELGSILRYSMDIKKESVPLRMEFEHIDNYLSLQANRFKNKLSYSLQCHPETGNIIVPKLILQPLVENSIIHGVENGKGTGKISVEAFLNNDLLTIVIVDNGKGLDSATIQAIKDQFRGNKMDYKEKGGIGLLNVLYRLRIQYGKGFRWDIVSVSYTETRITLELPLKEVDEYEGINRG
jgi:two-component system sensor histidine kinase YesM